MQMPPVGFEPHTRKSPLTSPWEPIYHKADGEWPVIGIWIREPHTNSRGLVHGGLVAALLDNVMGLAAGRALAAAGLDATGNVTVSLSVDFIGMAKQGQWLTFEPHFVKAGKTLSFVEASAIAEGIVIARGRSAFRAITTRTPA